jgi:hypothetical protein
MAHKVYAAIVRAIKASRLKEPFKVKDLRNAQLGILSSTCGTFPHKHSLGNPGNTSELFERVAPGTFRVLRPFKYGL